MSPPSPVPTNKTQHSLINRDTPEFSKTSIHPAAIRKPFIEIFPSNRPQIKQPFSFYHRGRHERKGQTRKGEAPELSEFCRLMEAISSVIKHVASANCPRFQHNNRVAAGVSCTSVIVSRRKPTVFEKYRSFGTNPCGASARFPGRDNVARLSAANFSQRLSAQECFHSSVFHVGDIVTGVALSDLRRHCLLDPPSTKRVRLFSRSVKAVARLLFAPNTFPELDSSFCRARRALAAPRSQAKYYEQSERNARTTIFHCKWKPRNVKRGLKLGVESLRAGNEAK